MLRANLFRYELSIRNLFRIAMGPDRFHFQEGARKILNIFLCPILSLQKNWKEDFYGRKESTSNLFAKLIPDILYVESIHGSDLRELLFLIQAIDMGFDL